MSEHDKKVIIKFARWLYENGFLNSVEVDYDYNEEPYEIITSLDSMMVVEDYLESQNEDGDIF